MRQWWDNGEALLLLIMASITCWYRTAFNYHFTDKEQILGSIHADFQPAYGLPVPPRVYFSRLSSCSASFEALGDICSEVIWSELPTIRMPKHAISNNSFGDFRGEKMQSLVDESRKFLWRLQIRSRDKRTCRSTRMQTNKPFPPTLLLTYISQAHNNTALTSLVCSLESLCSEKVNYISETSWRIQIK